MMYLVQMYSISNLCILIYEYLMTFAYHTSIRIYGRAVYGK